MVGNELSRLFVVIRAKTEEFNKGMDGVSNKMQTFQQYPSVTLVTTPVINIRIIRRIISGLIPYIILGEALLQHAHTYTRDLTAEYLS